MWLSIGCKPKRQGLSQCGLSFQGSTSLVDLLCYFCNVFGMLSRLLIFALWSSAGKGLTSWLSFVVLYCVFVTFPCGILGLVWYLIVSIPGFLPPFLLLFMYTFLINSRDVCK